MKSNKIVVVLGGESSEGSGLAVSYARNINTIYLNSHLYNEFVVRPQFELSPAETMWVTFTRKGATKPLKTLLMAARKKTEEVEQIVDGTSSTTEKTSYDKWEYFLKLPDAITLWQGAWQFSFTIAELPYVVKYKGTVDSTDELPASGNAIGDTYIVSEMSKYYVWSGTAWSELTVTAVSTSDVGEFTVNASVSAPLGAPADLDIQVMYSQIVDMLQNTQNYLPKVGENGNWQTYTSGGYVDSGVRADGTQMFACSASITVDASTSVAVSTITVNKAGQKIQVGDYIVAVVTQGSRLGLARLTAIGPQRASYTFIGYITGEKGVDGAKGDKGDTGAAGVGIASISSVQIATGTKVIITLTDGTQSEFLVSADSFGAITAIAFPYGKPTLTYDTTDGMHIHGVFRLTAAGSHYDVPFDQEIPLVYGDGLNADVAADGKTVLVKVADNVFRKSGGTITGSVTIGGDLTVQGTTSFVDSTHLRVSDKLIIVAKDNTVKLTSPAGLLAPKYDGTHSGALVFDGDGTAYVGDVVLNGNNEINVEKSDLQPLATRGALVNGNYVVWDEAKETLADSGYKPTDFVKEEELYDQIDKFGQLLYIEAYEVGDVPQVGMVLTLQTDKFSRSGFKVGTRFLMIETLNETLYWTALELLTYNSAENLCTAKITAVLGSTNALEEYLGEKIQSKLDKVTDATPDDMVYVKKADGTQTQYAATQWVSNGALVRYDSTGKLKSQPGTTDFDVVNKKQLDDTIAGVSSYEELTYAALKAKRDGGTLVKGKWYRITDYTCTTTQAGSQSAGHVFDIIVRADDTNVLNENAYAALHSGDTYFADCKLEAWQLKYCLDNDTEKFAWADSTNGKGVIYYMKDEWDNECPYDFKNIQFKRYKITASTKVPDLVGAWGMNNGQRYTVSTTDTQFFYTFSFFDDAASPNVMYDATLKGNDGTLLNDESTVQGVYGNVLKETSAYVMGLAESDKPMKIGLTNVVIYGTETYRASDAYYGCYSNTFGNDCYYNTFGNNCYYNTFGNGCYSNTFGNYCYSNTFCNNCYSNTFGNDCRSNTFGNSCYYNTFGNYCYSNTFGNDCYSNTFGNNVYMNDILNISLQSCFVKDGVGYIKFTASTAQIIKCVTVESGIVGSSRSNKLELFDTDLVNKTYPITITRESGTNGKYLMKWNINGACETGKYKATATAATWTPFTADMQSTSKGYVDTQVGNIDTVLTQLNNGTGV